MPNWKLSRALAACILAACAGTHSSGENPDPRKSMSATTPPTVVVHMTGLALIVPPSQVGDSTKVLLPNVAGHIPVLGFGIAGNAGNVDRLCLTDSIFGQPAKDRNICYVDLTTWQLEPFGDGGQRTPARKLPSFTPNVTELSGGQFLPAPDTSMVEVTFTTGWIGPNPCSLADWTLAPAGGSTSVTRSLANVVDWEIVNPGERRLTFIKRDRSDTTTAELPAADADGRIELVLANVRAGDRMDLPPMIPRPLGNITPTPEDFELYFALLRNPNDPRPAPQSLPRNGSQTAVRACAVKITGGEMVPRTGHGVGTFGCMPATGP